MSKITTEMQSFLDYARKHQISIWDAIMDLDKPYGEDGNTPIGPMFEDAGYDLDEVQT